MPWNSGSARSHICPVTALAPHNLHMARAKLVGAKVNFEIPANLADGLRYFLIFLARAARDDDS